MMASIPTEDLPDNTCVVCFKGVEIFSIGLCDHPVCYECSTRMRVLCRQNECPICRQDMPKVIFTKFVRPYNALKDINSLIDKKFKIVFETEDEKRAYEVLLAHDCSKCSKVFSSFTQLRDHVRRVHQLNYCELCVENLKILTRERRCYSRQELTRHREAGDIDDKSHRGHPLCKFCDTRYMDNDELYRHLRRDHLYCHFCDADGLDQYYSNYDFLRDHFRLEHYLCEEGDCLNEKFTAVFRSEIDLKAHKANIHGKGLGKAGLKQARTLELEFTLTPRPRPVHARPFRHRREDEISQTGGGESCSGAGPIGPVAPSVEEQQRLIMTGAPPSLEEDFPALGPGAEASVSLRLTSKQPSLSIQVSHPRFTTTVTSQNNYNLHFPALDNGPEAGTGAPSTTSASTMTSWSSAPKRPIDTSNGRKKAVQTQCSGGRKEEFPSLVVKESHKSAAKKLTGSAGSTASKVQPQPAPSSHIEQPQTQPSKTKKKKSKSGKGPAGGSEALEARERLTTVAKPKKKSEPKHTAENNRGVMADNNNGRLRTGGENNNQTEHSHQSSFIGDPEPSQNNKNKIQVQLSGGGGEDFPSLSASAPPGFTPLPSAPPRWAVKKPAKPPPGFQPPPTPRPPPGFSEINGEFPPLSELSNLSSSVEVYTYLTPNNFAKRNSTLVKLINGSLVGETLEEFKQISDAFRRGSLAAPEYYAHCREMMGPANFRELFPELLALLPDIDKQLELWKVYKADKARWIENGTVSKKKQQKQILDTCLTCGQILKLSDLNDHLRRHGRGVFGQTAVQTQEGGGQSASNPWASKQQGPPPQAT